MKKRWLGAFLLVVALGFVGEAIAQGKTKDKKDEISSSKALKGKSAWDDEGMEELPPFVIHGYFRFRSYLYHNFDLINTSSASSVSNPFTAYWLPYSERDPNLSNPGLTADKQLPTRRDANTLAWADVRFRLEPTINVSQDVRIKAQIDIFDNLVMGGTPDGFPTLTYSSPMMVFSQTQVPPAAGINSMSDSIKVKRVWGEVMTPFGLLRFGRMGSHWGMGMLANSGNCLDCDYGDTVDRVMFITKIAGHYIVPGMDFVSEGLLSSHYQLWSSAQSGYGNDSTGLQGRMLDPYTGRPHDMDQLDDVTQFLLAVAKRDNKKEIKEKLEAGKFVINYGMYNVLRFQSMTTERRPGKSVTDRPDRNPLARQAYLENRGARAYIGDIWFKFMYKYFKLELETCLIYGTVDKSINDKALDVFQFGLALRVENGFLHNSLKVGFDFGFASGDNDSGLGVRDLPFAGGTDGKSHNFKFDPNFHIDRILFREIVGTVTNAFYYKPWIQYKIIEGFSLRLDFIISHAHRKNAWPGKSLPLGFEIDFGIYYRSEDNFHASLTYGLLIPLKGLDPDATTDTNEAGVAQAIQTKLIIVY